MSSVRRQDRARDRQIGPRTLAGPRGASTMPGVSFVGRGRPLARLLAAVDEAAGGSARVVLVSGEAGIGKTTLVRVAASRTGWSVGWGTCADAERTPAFWPWSAALRGLLAAVGPADAAAVTRTDTAELARLLPALGGPPVSSEDHPADPEAARLRLFEAVGGLLERLARARPTVVVLDDLQWADESSLQLLEFVTQVPRPVPLVVVGAYRHEETGAPAARRLATIGVRGEVVALRGLSAPEVFDLVAEAVDADAARRWAGEVHRRTGGHPFLARQLAALLADPARPDAAVPAGAPDLVARRVERLSTGCRELVRAAAVAGNEVVPDVLGEVCGVDAPAAAALVEEGVRAGVLVRDPPGGTRLAHDLFRETVYVALVAPQRLALHQRIADALEHRHARGAAVVPAELARHCAAAVPLDGADRAIRWARSAARDERSRLAFGGAAAHLARARRAVEDAGAARAAGPLVDLLVEEADARARAGDPTAARALLADAGRRARALDDPERRGRVALGVHRLGARFAMPRDAVVAALDDARAALAGTGGVLEAQLTANLARELIHSVPEHRPRAGPLSERALALARRTDDPATLAVCLLARHDVLWTPGRAGERRDLAREIANLAARTGDAERHAEGLLLTASALLEDGSPAFRATLTEYLHATERRGEPRHDYLALTRRAALALLDGRLGDGERLVTEAAALGERICEPDAGNVRLSQLLGLVRARGEPDRLRATAAEAVRWWVGIPSHAHAVAAGFLALAGGPDDLRAARRALDTVLALDVWRTDRSYMWSIFVGELATAAVALGDRPVCAALLAELEPVAGACGVNGALVCFAGSNAHRAGVLAAALGRRDDARRRLEQALDVHRRLGARVWEAESHLELARLGVGGQHAERAARLAVELGLRGVTARLAAIRGRRPDDAGGADTAELRRDGALWRVGHGGTSAHLPDLKGLADLRTLLARPGREVHVLELAGGGPREAHSGPRLDAAARAAYRHRLAELDEDLAAARTDRDTGRATRLADQRSALLAELRRAGGLAGRSRPLGASSAERARKAVSARVREAIRRIAAVDPVLGAHLDRSVVTGTTCRYDPRTPLRWTL